MMRGLLTYFVLLCTPISFAQAANLVFNGDFEIWPYGSAKGFGDFHQNQLPGWNSDAYSFLFTPGSADTTGSLGRLDEVILWGDANGGGTGSGNGMPDTSPVGGNFVGVDGSYRPGPITQLISGLTIGTQYEVSFWWAAGQQYEYWGDTTSSWVVSLGNQSFTTPVIENSNHGFQPWREQSFVFEAQGTSQLLSFLSSGGPAGQPPFALLDGVSMAAVSTAPEAGTWVMMMVGFGLIGIATRRRRVRAPAIATH